MFVHFISNLLTHININTWQQLAYVYAPIFLFTWSTWMHAPSPFVQWYIATQSFSSPLSMLRSIVYPPLWVGELIDYIYHPMLQLFYQSNNIFPQWLPHQYDARVLWWTDGHRCQDCLSLIDGRYSAGYKPQMPHISSPRWKDKKGKHLNKPSKFAARIVV